MIERERGFEVELLDLSLLTSQYGRQILPCKACVSTAMPLCHWPCSCYPNHALGQVNDWMAEIYPMWAAAHGVMIVTPVNWYQAPTGLKAMIDRLVCADGGNPDPTSTGGKDPQKAKELEMKGWDYPRHLAGRAFSVVVHGDAAGTETLRRILVDWLKRHGPDLAPATPPSSTAMSATTSPTPTSHEALDRDRAFQEETRNAARALVQAVKLMRRGQLPQPDARLPSPTQVTPPRKRCRSLLLPFTPRFIALHAGRAVTLAFGVAWRSIRSSIWLAILLRHRRSS